MLSVLGMTFSDEERRDTLKYRLLAPSTDLGQWGHEYMRHLALEIGEEQNFRLNDESSGPEPKLDDIKELALALVPYFLKHNADADAVDLLSELEMIEDLPKYLDKDTYSRVCLYMVR
jgi:26S proteasome regulatory subunit N1